MADEVYEKFFTGMESLAQEYRQGSLDEKTLKTRLGAVQDGLSSLAEPGFIYRQRRKAFYLGLVIGLAILPAAYFIARFFHLFGAPTYWG